MRTFPILLGHTREEKRSNAGCPKSVPWSLVVPHEKQALRNHGGQSLEKLAHRGGLSPRELCLVLMGRPLFPDFNEVSGEEAVEYILKRVAAHDCGSGD